jgi:hypothetical protein
MKERLKERLSQRLPGIKKILLTRYVDKYADAVMQELGRQFARMTSEDLLQGEMDFCADAVSNACGRAKIDGKTHYIFALMQADPATSLVSIEYTGNNLTHRVSRACINPKYKGEIMQELKSLIVELEPEHLKDLERQANIQVRIDAASLSSYISATRAAIGHAGTAAKGHAYQEKLTRNLQLAMQLLSMAKEDAHGAYLLEYWEEIDSGRVHGHGLSIQRLPKEVRHAALGPCHRYDFKAASYALMTSYAEQIDPTLKTAALRDYVKHRSAIRLRVAGDVGISEEWMKSVFTSLGFGAELTDNPRKSIRGKLGAEKYQRLMANQEFTAIAQQLEQVSETILKHLGKAEFEFFDRTYSAINPKDQRKRNKRQLLAWVYQCMERAALDALVESVPESYELKLVVHDCIYLDRPLSAPVLADVKWKLRQQFSALNFEGEAIVPIHSGDWVDQAQQREVEGLDRHRVHIADEQFAAEEYWANCESANIQNPLMM